jgi:hypothetical protein
MLTKVPKNITNQYLNGVNNIFQCAKVMGGGGVTKTHLNLKTFIVITFLDIALLDITVNTPAYMVLLIILKSRHQTIYNQTI